MAALERVGERLLASTSERLMVCVCADGRDSEARVLGDALKRVALIKLQMSPKHEIAVVQAATPFRVVQEFTRDPTAVARALDEATCPRDNFPIDTLAVDALLGDAARYFSRCDVANGANESAVSPSSYRLLVVIRQNRQIDARQSGLADAFLANPRFSLDVVYWHVNDSVEQAQDAFDQLCAFDSSDPLANFYFTEVGDSLERLHQVLVLMLSNPAHRPGQDTAEQLLWSTFSPSPSVESGAR